AMQEDQRWSFADLVEMQRDLARFYEPAGAFECDRVGHLSTSVAAAGCGRDLLCRAGWAAMSPMSRLRDLLHSPRRVVDEPTTPPELEVESGWRLSVEGDHLVVAMAADALLDAQAVGFAAVERIADVVDAARLDHEMSEHRPRPGRQREAVVS